QSISVFAGFTFSLFLSDHIGKKTVFNSGTHNSRSILTNSSVLQGYYSRDSPLKAVVPNFLLTRDHIDQGLLSNISTKRVVLGMQQLSFLCPSPSLSHILTCAAGDCLLCLFTFSLLGQPWGSDPTHQTEIRLVDNCSGRVELLHHGEWGTICGDGWGIEEATVVCHEMGCGTGSMNQSRTWNGSGTSPIWLDGVHCRGTESSLLQCSASPLGRHGCDSGETASVVCSGKFINYEVRLIDGPTPCTGRVEVFHNKAWGTVCDNGWDLEDASVVCQEVGCGEALVAAIGARFGQGSGPIWMDEVNCTGKEKVLKKCPQEKSLSLTCDHRKDVGVECAVMRLADGRHRCTGRVELFLDGQWRMWGTVCDASWDIYDAQVVCRELGCGNALKAFRGAHHGQGFGPIWIEGVNCTGKEASLSECNRSPWGEHHCSHSQDASVECTGRFLGKDAGEDAMKRGNGRGRVPRSFAAPWKLTVRKKYSIYSKISRVFQPFL
uniref:Soluble scavenger receptor cysteine-rich domain-containing protein SSC5D n=1 Tax=Anolis carolinensis TaxID=28377 RepID=H9GRC2_ANOCA